LDSFSFLETTAEISITFAGFISIFLVLARRDGSFEPGVAVLIRLVLISSIGCLFFAALPLVLAGLSISGPVLWRLSSATCLLVGVGVSIYVVRSRHHFQPSALVPVGYSLNAAVFLALIANLAGWPAAPNGGVYLAAVWLILAIGAVNFIDLVFHRVLEPPGA
jgi:hypothetical protein